MYTSWERHGAKPRLRFTQHLQRAAINKPPDSPFNATSTEACDVDPDQTPT